MSSLKLRLDKFAYRQFDDKSYVGTQIHMEKTLFMTQLERAVALERPVLVDGYAPFCKHIFVRNFVPGLKVGAVPITDSNRAFLVSSYVARTEQELPVLTRWFPRSAIQVPDAQWLDVILYSRAQIDLETAAMNQTAAAASTVHEDYDWGIISVKGQLEDHETPMTPITAMRNALGREEGGSGVPLDRTKYLAAVKYWEAHASIV